MMLTHSVKSLLLVRTLFATAAFLFISLCAGGEARAGFANLVVVQDMPTRVVIMVDHSAVGGVATVSGGLVNWDVVLSQFNVINNQLGISITAQHEIFGQPPLNVPHVGDVNPNPNVLTAILMPLVPGQTVVPLTVVGPVSHGLMAHFDWLQYSYTPVAVGTSRLTIQLDHTTNMTRPQFIPEPATLLLLGSGLAGVAIKMRKRFKSRKTG